MAEKDNIYQKKSEKKIEKNNEALKGNVEDNIDVLSNKIQKIIDESLSQTLDELSNKSELLIREKVNEILKTNIDPKIKTLSSLSDILSKKEKDVAVKEAEAIADFPNLLGARVNDLISSLDEEKQKVLSKIDELSKKENELNRRQQVISEKELKLENELNCKINQTEIELATKLENKNKEIQEIKLRQLDEIAEIRNKELEKISNLKAQKLKEVEESISEKKLKEEDALRKKLNDMFVERNNEIKHREEECLKREREVEIREQEVLASNSALKIKEDFLKDYENKIENKIEERTRERLRSLELREDDLKKEIERLRGQVSSVSSELSKYDELNQKLGNESPEAVLSRLKITEKSLHDARNMLLNFSNENDNETIKSLNATVKQLNQKISDLEEKNTILEQSKGNNELLFKCDSLILENENLKKRLSVSEDSNVFLQHEYERLVSTYGNTKNREERIKDAITPLFIDAYKIPVYQDLEDYDPTCERKWLDYIISQSDTYGLHFPKRLVYAFHTCLKTSEWSPLTVLAGVSGTGKSELPRFYSLFGGFEFLPVAVQPNWDSQESMLGFFNSIDNKFDSQPVLNFLSQASIPASEDYKDGLRETMNMILLDEMNLAHVELYFADFLSKLESRRSVSSFLPSIDVKLGAGIKPYQLELTRNVLFVGTMNQDETTKSLSDKVLDRGNVLFFPRPKKLKSREKLHELPSLAYRLPEETWVKWCNTELIINEKEIEPFKQIIEKINDSLAHVGRALGHRVWQSIEYYINNYPDICEILFRKNKDDRDGIDMNKLKESMQIAFEDALVQKVMPKLRGIETSGESKTRCLDSIKAILSEGVFGKPLAIVEDFNLACNNPFGQFIWNSANYINVSE